jgi:UDP-N-acetylglucosamine 2-epimerase
MYDVFLKFKDKADSSNILERLGLSDKEYGLLTLHRAENVDNPIRLRSIVKGIQEAKTKIIFPIHPRTANRLREFNIPLNQSKIKSIEPVGYIDMLKLLKHAKLVLTDSGGLQKEAFWSQTPCITLRDSTEWVETVEAGVNQIVGADPNKIAQAIKEVKEKYGEIKEKFTKTTNPFGDEQAARRIVKAIESFTYNLN